MTTTASSRSAVGAPAGFGLAARFRRRYGTLLPMLPALILLVLFFFLPAGRVVVEAAYDGGWTTKHLARPFVEPVYIELLLRTGQIALITTAACLVLGYPAALALLFLPKRLQTFALFFILVPLWMSVLSRSFAWMILLGRNGPVNAVLQDLGIIAQPVTLLFTTGTVTVAMTQILLPFMILTCLNGLRSVDLGLLRAARIHGASRWSAFRHVLLPLGAPGAVAGSILVFILAMGFFVTPAFLGGPRNMMIGNVILFQITETVNWGFAAALALLLLVTTLLLVGLLVSTTRTGLQRRGAPA